MELSPAGDADRTFAAMLSVKEYPPHTHAGQLDPLFRQPHELVPTESFAFTDRQTSLDRMNLAIRRMRAADDDAISLRQDLVVAKDDVAAGRSCFGEHHMSIMVKALSLAALNEAVADIQAALTEIGAIVVREDVAMEPAFWAQFPGNFRFIARKALISSGNFAGLASCHNQPVGRATGNPWGPAVTVLESTAASPYYFNFHHGDLGNFLLIGPSGSGKTVILNFLLAQAQKFEPRIVFFDKDRGAEIFLRALGGHYDVLRPGVMTGFNPLQLPDRLPIAVSCSNGWLVSSPPGARLSPPMMRPGLQTPLPRTSNSNRHTGASASFVSCSPAYSGRMPATWPPGWRPGPARATRPGCSTTNATCSTSRPARSAST